LSADLKLRATDLAWRAIDGEVVAVDVVKSTYLSGNVAAALLWEMLAEGTTRAAMAARLVEQFGIDLERAEQDVAAFVADLEARALLTP
jgi:hypothetical protein